MPMSERFLFCSSYVVSSIWLALKTLCSLLNQSDKKTKSRSAHLGFSRYSHHVSLLKALFSS